jgi:hypothetical protein
MSYPLALPVDGEGKKRADFVMFNSPAQVRGMLRLKVRVPLGTRGQSGGLRNRR